LLDPIYVDLIQSSEARLRLRAQLAAGLKAGSTKVKLKLPDGSFYDKDGTLEFAEVSVDEATGSVTLRAQFPNPDDTLLPGMYVRAVLDQAVNTTAILVPQQGVSHDPKGNAVALVVGADNKVEPRPLEVDRAIGDRWLVTSGLKEGDKLIVEGLNKIGPGMPVKPTEVKLGAPGEGSGAPGRSPQGGTSRRRIRLGPGSPAVVRGRGVTCWLGSSRVVRSSRGSCRSSSCWPASRRSARCRSRSIPTSPRRA
jgi:membrane fusion protein (multidrug efflux system)